MNSETLDINISQILSLRGSSLSLDPQLEEGENSTLYAIMDIRSFNIKDACIFLIIFRFFNRSNSFCLYRPLSNGSLLQLKY